jgi:FixJ family two-component response regulator
VETRHRGEDLRARYGTLTRRERQVFALVTSGLLNKQVGFELGTSEKTVKVQRARVIEKMGARSLADLVRMADRLGVGPGNALEREPAAPARGASHYD